MLYAIVALCIIILSFFIYRCDATFYAPQHCIQKLFGYNDFYDKLADVFLNIQNRTICFTYNNKDWRIELWKGRYWTFIGGEVGVYNKNQKRTIKHYRSAKKEELIYMSMQLYHNGTLLFARPYDLYWWINGFKFLVTKKVSPDVLSLHVTITFWDFESRDTFVNAYTKKYDAKTIHFSSSNQNKVVEIEF